MSDTLNAPEEVSEPQRLAREKLRIVQRLMVAFGLLAFLCMMYTGWWLVGALVFELAALATGIWSLFLMPKAQRTGFDYTIVIFFLLGLAYLTFGTVVQLIFVEQTNAYAECLQNAQTLSRQGKCNQQLEDQLLSTLLGGE